MKVRNRIGILVASGVLFSSSFAFAADDAAKQLVSDADKLAAAYRYGDACPKYDEAAKLAPSAVAEERAALCYELWNKKLDAWKRFSAALALAEKEKSDRLPILKSKVELLESKFPKLTITLIPADEVPGLVVKRDGQVLTKARLNAPLPLTPGERKTFYGAMPQTPAVFRSIDDEIEEAFRYKTRFKNRAGSTVGFAPDLCEGDAIPYCYDPATIEEIAGARRLVKPRRFDLKLLIRGAVWRRIKIEVSFPEGRIAEGSGWIVPPQLHDPIRQDAVLLTRGNGSSGPAALLKYLRGDKARSIIKSFGYE